MQRVHPPGTTNSGAVAQSNALAPYLSDAGPVPLFGFAAGYDPLQPALAPGETRAAIVVRSRRGRCCYAGPAPDSGVGRPRRPGHTVAGDDPPRWPAPGAALVEHDRQSGAGRGRAGAGGRGRAGAGGHAKPGQDHARPLPAHQPVVSGTRILVALCRLPGRTRKPPLLWRAGAEATRHGPGRPDLALLWRASVRRFALAHTSRFRAQILTWTAPRVRQPAHADRWTWLVVPVSTALRPARPRVRDLRLPWEQPLAGAAPPPERGRRAFPRLRAVLGTPAVPPRPCGRSPGRPKGHRSAPAPRAPARTRTA